MQAEKVNKLKLKNKKKSEKNRVEVKSKPYLKELPDIIKNIIGNEYVIYKIDGDGACALRATAGWIFKDQTLGPYLGRNVNEHFVQNWEYWKDIIIFPFEREIGIGKKKKFYDKNELFDFFKNSKEGAFMWRDHEDFVAVANIYQFVIKIITVTHSEDPKPVVNIIEPDPGYSSEGIISGGQISEMILLHTKDTHYDLIVSKTSSLAWPWKEDLITKESFVKKMM